MMNAIIRTPKFANLNPKRHKECNVQERGNRDGNHFQSWYTIPGVGNSEWHLQVWVLQHLLNLVDIQHYLSCSLYLVVIYTCCIYLDNSFDNLLEMFEMEGEEEWRSRLMM